jgi:hypothetical protein
MAHTASIQAGQVTGDVHLRSRFRAKQVKMQVVVIIDKGFGQSPAGYFTGDIHTPIKA